MRALASHRFAHVAVVVAHMDDESLFAGGTLRRLADQGCAVAVIVATRVEETNAPREDPSFGTAFDVPRQHRRLVAFGRACGMIGVTRTHLLDHGNTNSAFPFYSERYETILPRVTAHLDEALRDIRPSIVVTHGRTGEYGHAQHILVSRAVREVWRGPLWLFDAKGQERVTVDLAWKRRLLDCYRHGTTQDALWSPYTALRDATPLGAWLGDVEAFGRYG